MPGSIRVSTKPWETPELTAVNRLPMHGGLIPQATRAAALRFQREASPWFRLLNGTWKFKLLPRPEAVKSAWLSRGFKDSGWRDITVPGNWTLQGVGDKPWYTNIKMPFTNQPPLVPAANPTGVYRTRFSLPRGWRGRRVVLHFGGVESYYEVTVNDQRLGMAKDSRLPSEFDITGALRPGVNTLAVMVVRWSDSSYIEDQDHWWMAGIFRDVYLYSTPDAYLEDIFARADYDVTGGDGLLTVDTTLNFTRHDDGASPGAWPGAEGPKTDFLITAEVVDATGATVFAATERVSGSYRRQHYESRITTRLHAIQPWSAESPTLYGLVVTLSRAEDGRVLDIRSTRIGFRNVVIRDRQLLINGRAVMIKGVNRHDHHPTLGKTIPRETMIEDILLLKRFNFNAVRTSHYPNDAMWYDLCDEYGLYVLDEANIEAHDNYWNLCRDPRWAQAFLERGMRMVKRDKNHPCIFGWSLGNETGHGENHLRLADAIRAYDPSRILHHEGELKRHWTQGGNDYDHPQLRANDFANPMYEDYHQMIHRAETTHDPRPYILCEYSHAMGNSCGGLRHYWEAFDSIKGLQGGFIWDWVDQGILQHDKQGRPYWAYGGDFGEPIHDANFCCNGMVGPDRIPHPSMWEFKKLAQPVAVDAIDLAAGRVRVRNKQDFSDMRWLTGTWEVLVDGALHERGALPALDIGPGAAREVVLPCQPPVLQPGQECHLNVRFQASNSTPWCPAGHEVAWEQFALPVHQPAPLAAPPRMTTVERRSRASAVTLSAGDITLTVDSRRAVVSALTVGGQPLLHEGPMLSLWRAATDNDGIRGWSGNQSSKPMGQWMAAGFHRLRLQQRRFALVREEESPAVELTHIWIGTDRAAPIRHVQRFSFTPQGELRVHNTVDAHRSLPTLPRIGVVLQTVPGFERLEWFGRGPHENYIDRNAGAAVGRYTGTVSEQYHPYVVPQENGNKTDVRWFRLDGKGLQLRVTAEPTFEFSAHHFTEHDLFACSHINEVPRRAETVVHLDLKQRGLGTGSCGPQTYPPYCIDPGRYTFSYRLLPTQP